MKTLRKRWEQGELGVVFDTASPRMLTVFRRETGAKLTGAMIGNRYVIVFWDRLVQSLTRRNGNG